MQIEEFTTDQLKEELKKREAEENRILPIKNPDFTKLIECCEYGVKEIARQGYSKDLKHYVYETAMQAVYGPKCFEWINIYDQGC
jgi:hypothetical protein